MAHRRVYLAGPDVFLKDAIAVGEAKKRLCAAYGFEGLYPLDGPLAAEDGAPLDARIYRACVAMLHRADFAIFHLTPFRGVGADVGTVFELGMAVALEKPVFGYTNDPRDLLARALAGGGALFDVAAGVWRDRDGLEVENFGNADNLMVDRALADAGAPLIRHAAQAGRRFRDLAGFEACLRLAAARFAAAGDG
jgi:nucleoside 2-deoxyribosyltransferase